MADKPEIFTHIKNSLIQQRLNLKSMMALLERELDAVKTRNGDALNSVAAEKEQLLQQISELDAQFNSEQFIPFLTSEPELVELKSEIMVELEQCQQKNEVIYLTATQTQVAIDDVKRLLLGGSRNTTYDSYGQKKSGTTFGKGIKA